MGDDAMCKAQIEPMLPKSMYSFNMFWPVAEARTGHVLGETVMKWGYGRNIPGAGDDAVYMVWRWNDCCMKF
ncbi:TraU protein [compost metagenome]